MNPQSPQQQQQKNQPSGYPRPDEESKKQAGARDQDKGSQDKSAQDEDKQKSGQKW